jgi:hypothetical protein
MGNTPRQTQGLAYKEGQVLQMTSQSAPMEEGALSSGSTASEAKDAMLKDVMGVSDCPSNSNKMEEATVHTMIAGEVAEEKVKISQKSQSFNLLKSLDLKGLPPSLATQEQSSQGNPSFYSNTSKSDIEALASRGAQTPPNPLTIHLSANTSNDLPWDLKPTLSKIKVYPGDTALTFYIAHNLSNQAQTGVATYNISPAKAGIYFNKIQCFCFEEQRLKGNESVELPILFFIDSDFLKDPKMKDIESINLSYTFFKTI